MTAFVLDASASVELVLDTPRGRDLQARIPHGAEWWVPEHFFVEVGSALRRAELRGVVPPARLATAFERLRTAPLRRVQVRPLLAEAWTMRGNLTVADALYVVLAGHLRATLVTADVNLANAPGLPVSTLHP